MNLDTINLDKFMSYFLSEYISEDLLPFLHKLNSVLPKCFRNFRLNQGQITF